RSFTDGSGDVDTASIFRALEEIKEKLSSGYTDPCVYEKEPGSPADFHVIPIDEYEGARDVLHFETVSGAMEYFYSHRDSSNRLKQKSSDLAKSVKNQLKKLYLKKKRLGEDLIKAQNADQYRLFGELITANLHKIKTGDEEVTLTNYYDGKPVTIPLDVRYAPAKNAQLYFKKYGKEKTALKEKQIQMDENDKDILYLESVSSYIDNASEISEIDALRTELTEAGFLRKRHSKMPEKKDAFKPHEYATSDGFRVLAGRNNKENDRLTMKTAGPKDWWFHTKDIPGSHIILFTEGRELTETAIMEAASIAAWHSKGRESENVPVDYTQVKYVKKPNGARPGMVIFTDNRTVYVTPRLPSDD
ncbi:MAG: NFACT family protein, partial [Firmicutes bacterium]|nr:NFACT family protein [Bacillota bacterium]